MVTAWESCMEMTDTQMPGVRDYRWRQTNAPFKAPRKSLLGKLRYSKAAVYRGEDMLSKDLKRP